MRLSAVGPVWRESRGRRLACVAVCVAVAALACAGRAAATVGVWHISPVFAPAHFAPGASGELIATVANRGAAGIVASPADPSRIDVQLPAGVSATSIEEYLFSGQGSFSSTCELATLTCEATSGTLRPYHIVEIVVYVTVAKTVQPGARVRLSVSGGGLEGASSDEAIPIGSAPVGFGVERFEQAPLNEDGSIDAQAGSHPFQFTTTLTFDQGFGKSEPEEEYPQAAPLAMPRNLAFDLPPGLIGNPESVPQCPLYKFQPNATANSKCPPDTQVGVATSLVSYHGVSGLGGSFSQPLGNLSPVYNLAPSPGEPARFGYVVITFGAAVPVFLDTSVRTGGDYGVVVSVHNITQDAYFVGAELSFWGVPGDPRHNPARGNCLEMSREDGSEECSPEVETTKQTPFLILPPSCTGLSDPLTSSMEADTWEHPGERLSAEYTLRDASGSPAGMVGCNRLGFEPSIKVAPDSQSGSTPTGLSVDVHVPQQAVLNPHGLAESNVKATTVTLPAGVVLNPAAADGLQACSEGEVGFIGVEPAGGAYPGMALFTPTVGEPFCPDASKIGTAKITTPLLPNALEGAVYLAAQNENPFGSLIAMYLMVQDPVSGTLVKLAGEVSLDPVTGQVVSTFKDTPQLPFEDLELHFFGGARAPLATPGQCGAYTTTAAFTPWSGSPPVESASTFDVTSGPNGAPCQGSLPFSPTLTAGVTSNQAGGFSPFTMTMSREDGNQSLQAIQLHMPPGLSGLLAGVKLCGEAEADAGTCGPESQIGETIVSVGLGGDPFSVTGGKVYITGPYEGAPFGLSIVNPAVAGPFNLGKVIVRAKIEVDPHTAQLTITSDDSGPYKIPTILDGIPLQIKHVNVLINRPGFTFNPSNCTSMGITGSIDSTEGATQALSVPFQVTNCAILGFAPKFAVSTSAKTSRARGASLLVKLTYPQAPFGSQANLAKVKVELPEQLPSRLSTLQKACTAATFEANPANCPATSIVGHAKALTPLLPVPLEGPAYFVSHGGEAFPSLIIVLQGDNVTLDLVGSTFISKAGVTSSTFKTVPDAPVGSFELTLPEGPYSALGAPSNLCKSKLAMPTEFVAQNGAEIHESTRIAVTGCPKAKKAGKRKRHGKHGMRTRGKGKSK